jgi:3'-phosphoadenosine 5'-phosphosulfate sulfotransferase (PAPS reductase)/FAD synthetase
MNFALFSGGHDSLVSTHVAMEDGDADEVLHLDTGTGIPENQQFVEDVCERFDWPLRIETPEKTLTEFAKDWGFPGAGAHSWVYRYFKGHSLNRVASDVDGKPRFYTGVRESESRRRKMNVGETEEENSNGQWVWVNPIADWSSHDVYARRQAHDLPANPVVENIHRSGECFCGAFAHRDEELIDLEAHYPDHYEWLLSVEDEVQGDIGSDAGTCFWGHGGLSSAELRALVAEHDDMQMVLCSDCGPEREQGGSAMSSAHTEWHPGGWYCSNHEAGFEAHEAENNDGCCPWCGEPVEVGER